jgi:hypothetical protein
MPARYANSRPGLDQQSRRAVPAVNDPHQSTADDPAGDIRSPDAGQSADSDWVPSSADDAL